MIEIKPDPKHPRGGFAELSIPGAAGGDPVTVAVYNSYQQKWLGPEGWQPNRVEMPARAATQDGDTLRVIVGPDIVNNIEEDTPVRIEIGGTGYDTYWPDNINAGPDEAVIGDIGGTGAAPEAKGPTVVVTQPEPDNSEEVLSEADSEDQEDLEEYEDEGDEEPRKSRLPGIIATVVALAAVLAVVAYIYLDPSQTNRTTEVEPEPTPQPVATNDPCGMSALTELGTQGFGALANKMRECGSNLSADNALGLVEKAVAAGDGAALALFGALYDNGVTDDAIEGQMGLTFSDDPARAAEYYSRAATAGSQDGTDRLQAVCNRLLIKTDTLSRSAHEDYCQ